MRGVVVLLLALLHASPSLAADAPGYPAVTPGAAVILPRDAGAHPDYRTEWWYVTGWLATPEGQPLGFQVTFFRSRPTLETGNPSRFASGQVLIAHAAISDPARGRLWHDQRLARAGFGLAEAAIGRTEVSIRDWSLKTAGPSLSAEVAADGFGFKLRFEPTSPAMPNGDRGYSQKGPATTSASYYYSLPGLAVAGTVTRAGVAVPVSGRAWLDHEWSSAPLDAQSVGWDWVGLNLEDGGALMAFRIRDRAGGVRWAGGTYRDAAGHAEVLAPAAVSFEPGRRWRSPRTAIEYPVEWGLRAGPLHLALVPLMDDQESDSRLSTGAVYWEGAVTARMGEQVLGHGYLELTGYGAPLRLR